MPPGFPPKPSFPIDLDSDRTLFLVHNTSESKITSDNPAWSEEIQIQPVSEDKREIWADNGFANISGELFYYDAVEKTNLVGSGFEIGKVKVDENGKITSISVESGGSGYMLPTVVINGDGFGAKAEVVVENGTIVDVEIINGGMGYTAASVSLNFQGKVKKLKRCARNIGGKKTKFNRSGTWVRGFVIAEHHNQLVNAVVATQDYMFDLEEILDGLESEPVCADDSYCVSVVFDTNLANEDQNDPCGSVVMEYTITIQGAFNTFNLDFGDGQSTNSAQSGTHTYAPGVPIDPILTVVSDDCTVVQTPLNRSTARVPEVSEDTTFTLPIPEVPAFPTLSIPPFDPPEVPIELPQIVFPCLDVTPISQAPISIIIVNPFPSVIPPSFGPIPFMGPASFTFGPAPLITPATFTFGPVPSINRSITFGPVPSVTPTIAFGPVPSVTPTIAFGPVPSVTPTIAFGPVPSVTTIINFGHIPYIQPTIYFGNIPYIEPIINFGNIPYITPTIYFGNLPNLSVTASFYWGAIPLVSIYWGSAPRITATVTVKCEESGTASFMRRTLNDDFIDDFDSQEFDIEVNDLGIPSEIRIVAPKMPDIKIKHDIPEFINVLSNLPDKIEIYQKEIVPNEIRIVSEDVPKSILLDASAVPESIKIDSSGIPTTINLVNIDVPSVIRVDGSEIPDVIKVVGIPDVIEVKMPSEIVAKLEVPENLEIPLVYKGGPVPIQFDTSNLLEGEDRACFALVPCGKK